MDLADDISGRPASTEPSYQPATLQRRLEQGPLPPRQCCAYARQLLDALTSVHEAGMVHRDVKPANCLFVESELKLADFGLLTAMDQQISRVGTQKYMPPDGRMDAQADVYAAGLVIYEMMTGLPAERFPHLGSVADEISSTPTLAALLRLIASACQPNPKLRPRDASALLSQLMASETQEPPTLVRSRRRFLKAVAVAAILTVLVAEVGYWTTRPPPTDVRSPPPRVHINFVTRPFEATVFLNGIQQFEPNGFPCKTPCTIDDLPARKHLVVFKHAGLPDLDAGQIDFAREREVTVQWGPAP